jgi:predicted molibdopterin-dependent oxidoreductase YjgC
LLDLLLAAKRPQIVLATGVGIPGDEALVARAAVQVTSLLSGSPGVLVLGEKANVQGLVDVGLHPELLPGHRRISAPGMVDEVERLTGVRPPSTVGWSARELLASAENGKVGALLAMESDPIRGLPRSFRAREALEGAGFVICVDPFMSETARCADVVLPVAMLAERRGSTVGHDGVRRVLERAVPPPHRLPGDGDVLHHLAERFAAPMPSADDLLDEMDRVVGWPFEVPTFERLMPADHPTDRLRWSGILLDGSPQLFHSGSLTIRSKKLCELAPPVAVRLNPADALDLGVSSGEVVAVASGDREVLLRARIDATVRRRSVVVLWGAGRDGASELVTDSGTPVAVTLRGSR